ncbi:MAG: phosphate--acyl-ACP acyltransferase, partial [Clostridia bacterium]|nr:phosphate--acyl-ACP acyltransferase [Clostridia bacterium]
MKILIDAMSGDNAPLEILKGAEWAAREFKDHTIMLVGDENVISDIAVKNEINIAGMEIINAPSVITMEDSPLSVVRDKRDSSMG